MRAIVMSEHGGPEVLTLRELPDPVPADGDVLIAVKAFGLNHADTYMRSGVWSFGIDVLGIECAGVVLEDPSGALAAGTPVVALVGGLARTRNGTYAERVTVPAANVVPVRTTLGWPTLASLPEVYATAWVARHANLGLADGGVDAVLDLVGNSVLRDSLRCARPRGRVCQVGFLGGLDPVADFNPLADLPSGVQLSTFASAFVLGDADFPLAEVPLQEIAAKVERGAFAAAPKRVFALDEVAAAHRLMDAGRAGGKLVVTVAP